MREILARLVDPNFMKAESSSGLSRALNVLMVRIIDNANPNYTFRCLLRIISETTDNATNRLNVCQKYLELTMKCLWKITKGVGGLISSRKLVVEDLLFDIHDLLVIAPPQYWKVKAAESKGDQGDMPHRTVKTILHEIVNNLGVEAMSYASVLPNIQDNHVVNYLRVMILNYEKKNSNRAISTPLKERSNAIDDSTNPSDVDINKKLDDIFSMISDKELTKQGIRELHNFQKHNPGAFVLIEARLSQTGTYFQGYIRRGLASLQQSELATAPKIYERPASSPMKNVEGDVEKYKETLAKLQGLFRGKEAKVNMN